MIEYLIPLLMLCFIQSGTPGPNNIMLTSSGKNFGFIKTIPHAMGVVFGFLFLLIVLSFGLVTIFNQYPFLQEILKILGSFYLLYLAYKIFKSDDANEEIRSSPITFLEASLFQFVNPKGVMMAITTISTFTNFNNYDFINSYSIGVIFILICFLISNLFAVTTWTLVGIFLNNFIKSKKAIKRFNSIMSSLLVLTIILIYVDIQP